MEEIKMKCIIVDDEPMLRQHIAEMTEQIDFLDLVETFPSALAATSRLQQGDIDLIFLDINMPYLSGIDFLDSLENPPLCIFITAYSEYALEGFRLQAVDYLLKPIIFQRFYQASTKAYQLFVQRNKPLQESSPNDNMLFVRQGDAFVKISWTDILYAESMQNYTKLHFKERTITIHQTMLALEEALPGNHFFRIHKSYLVNVNHIDIITGGRVYIQEQELPISRTKREELLQNVVFKKLLSR
ncbi:MULTISPECIES: LytR/AlgR family response regulator transcription factor [Sphingobacterium]|jgi:DNA-binding LytR/AlgR family response regulator|uniref:LytR/AlgR family response regulator transcription factor n=1 Tax=Sphingobacterium TaxID=28453 RepID=UPI002584C85A|nr:MULTISPECIES: LytTR family DNA-binding domain-containing protein [Sphingobacterium]WET69864.1 MAG: LytTR family DNA-binding domain-containing protein [Sphingobacterium sp.]